MNTGKTLFAQLTDFLPWKTFGRIVARCDGDSSTGRWPSGNRSPIALGKAVWVGPMGCMNAAAYATERSIATFQPDRVRIYSYC